MKKYCSIFLLITALACQKESDKVTILHATVEDSRTTLDYPSILWSPDDAIVVNGKTSTAISIYNDGHGADFTLPELTAPYSAVYPASAYATSVRAILPSEQKYVPGGFDPSAALMWGYSEDNPDIRFQCGVALLKFTINGTTDTHNIKRLEIKAIGKENMSGVMVYTPGSGFSSSSKNDNSVTVSGPDIPQGSPVYAAIVPKVYASGIKVRVVDMLGHYRDFTSPASFTAEPGYIYNTNLDFEPTGTLIEGGADDAGDSRSVTKQGTLIRTSVADPCLYYMNGMFYLTMTGSSNIALIKDASPEQLTTAVHPTTASTHVYQSSKDGNVTAMFGAGAEINGTWSPEIHYFSESDFPGNSGWYMFLALREKDIVNGIATSNYVRMVVLKSLSDGPEGPYGDPVTGAANQSRQMLDSEGNGYDEWACGQSVLRIPDGQYAGIYAMWVAETGRGQGAGKFYQKIMISRMALPWQLSGETGVVTTPTQDWEKKGSDDVLPMVVEGSTAIYGDHGEIFLAYCGSGYWSDYGLGQLTLARNGGDYANPLETSSWIKYEGNPVFSSTGTKDLRGAGHAFFLTDNEGMRFMCYHAYPYENGVRGSSRNAYLEPYSIDYDSVSETAPQGLLRLGLLETGKTAPVTSTFSFHLKK